MPVVQGEDIQKVWEEFFEKRDSQSLETLTEHYLPQVRYTAERLCARLPATVELDDAFQTGVLGLMSAIQRFDPQKGVLFETYCQKRIHGSIVDALRKTDWVPRLVRTRARQLQKPRKNFSPSSDADPRTGNWPGN